MQGSLINSPRGLLRRLPATSGVWLHGRRHPSGPIAGYALLVPIGQVAAPSPPALSQGGMIVPKETEVSALRSAACATAAVSWAGVGARSPWPICPRPPGWNRLKTIASAPRAIASLAAPGNSGVFALMATKKTATRSPAARAFAIAVNVD